MMWGINLGLHAWVYNQTLWGPSIGAHNTLVYLAPSVWVSFPWRRP